MQQITEEDYAMLKEAMNLDDLDIKILKSYDNNEKKVSNYVATLMLYNSVRDTYIGLLRFIFVTIPIFVLFPIWRIVFDVYRSIKEYKLNDESEQD